MIQAYAHTTSHSCIFTVITVMYMPMSFAGQSVNLALLSLHWTLSNLEKFWCALVIPEVKAIPSKNELARSCKDLARILHARLARNMSLFLHNPLAPILARSCKKCARNAGNYYPARACASKGLCDRSWCLLYIIYILYICKTFFYLSKYSLSEVYFNTDRLLIEFNGLWYSLAARQVFVAITNPDSLSFG